MRCAAPAILLAVLGACQDFKPEIPPLPGDPAAYGPLERYEPMKVPADNPMTAEKAALGWQLFFDKRLSGDGALSCYSCHLNEKGLTDGVALGKGGFGKPLTRSSPTLWNIGYHQLTYWDGRADSLEKQAMAAWKGVNMGAKDPGKDEIRADILQTLNGLPGYAAQFKNVFGGPATAANVAQALACYMRTIISRDTPWDRYQRGDKTAVSASAVRGWETFQKAKCTNCHSGVLFTDQQFHNVGIGMSADKPDLGRFNVSKVEKDKGAFKTPTLRDVVDSAPYFHDGSVKTLEEAVRLMLGGGLDNPHLDRANLEKTELSDAEFKDLIEFLRALDEPTRLKEPALPR
jgi:cytochrome c peroxidase